MYFIMTQPASIEKKYPASLIKEVLNDIPVFYKGYKAVIANQTKLEDIMGCSGLQAEIVAYLLRVIFTQLPASKYRIYTNEIGSHISKKNNLSHDIAIFSKAQLTPDKITANYVEVPAKVIIEVDVDVESDQFTEMEYVFLKTDKLHVFGVEKAVWIFTNIRKVAIAETGKDWLWVDWNKDIELLDGCYFNVGKHLMDEGIVY